MIEIKLSQCAFPKPGFKAVWTFSPFLEPGALLEGKTGSMAFDKYWDEARHDTFEPPEFILTPRKAKLR